MSTSKKSQKQDTRLAHAGRDPARFDGFVNTPIYRGSTVLYPTLQCLEANDQDYSYGRLGTPTVDALQTALAELEGGHATLLTPSGLSAISATLLSFVSSGDDILVSDSVYRPTRRFCENVLKRLGVATTYYDPLIGGGIAGLLTDKTKLVFTESPGSQTFEVQDIPAIAEAAHKRGAVVIMDNTWATPLYFKPFSHGVDVSIHAATKYIVGHADAMLGAITTNKATRAAVARTHDELGLCPGPEDVYLGLRGLRSLSVRLARHQASGLEMAEWLAGRPEVAQVIHPARPGDPGYALWQRDFTGASGLFSIVLKPCSQKALAAMLDGLTLFGMGYSWGGYESLILPFDPRSYRSATTWQVEGSALRLHIGLEDVEDLKADLDAGFARLAKA
ncbi:cystathionine beta-lyase [Methyloceanibacter marginalis]|jgi:cysteine-S-conjugate beta-lyase|uniref:Cystathionine beta-lyase n=1 Tax=Methyloceanibacter marginalis TaxID=1774971 RepID=A0A1E3WCA6_9HYPH|nr:cystathionine beta-lyase [Methyloceanibacter marginalis]ODS03152.1 cystathionine beta-lyase [Methyloceanibacter marginalis]